MESGLLKEKWEAGVLRIKELEEEIVNLRGNQFSWLI